MMTGPLKQILDWSEVWALFIPLIVLYFRPAKQKLYQPIIIYLWVALFLNITSNIIWKYNVKLEFPVWLQSNLFIYNAHSVFRFLLFSWFFSKLNEQFLPLLRKAIPIAFIIFVIINFCWLESFTVFSSRLFALESAILLYYCLQYFLFLFNQDQPAAFKKMPVFWIVTGLSIYVAINFFIFLFYKTLSKQFEDFAIDIWYLHNISYIILCIFLAKAFYESDQ